MAAFSFQYQQHHPFHFDSLLSPNTPVKNQLSVDDDDSVMNPDYVSQFYPLLETTAADLDVRFCNSTSPSVDGSSAVAAFSESEPSSLTKKQSTDTCTVVDKFESGEQVTRKLTDMKRRSSVNSAQSKNAKSKRQKKCSNGVKEEEEKRKEEGPTAYIHVRARRGQATDSHSLAERVRREKISERMKMLQRLVPGCDKVTGKALMLDEIINYVRFLQNHVEFLSMKLASLNPLSYDFGTDLDAFMFRQEGLSSLSSSLPHMQQCNSPIAFADATTTTIATFPVANNYPLTDTSFIQDPAGCLLWEVGEQRQKLLTSSGFTNNLCTSFH